MLRVKTYIKGFDTLIEGGFPPGSVVLLAGGPGTGKTTFSLEYLYRGAMHGERGLYVGTEQGLDALKRQARRYGWKLDDLVTTGLLEFAFLSFTSGKCKITELEKTLKKYKPKRLVIDSVTTFLDSYTGSVQPVITPRKEEREKKVRYTRMEDTGVHYRDKILVIPLTEYGVKKTIVYDLINTLKKYDVTTVMTSESPEKGEYFSRDTVSEFMADGVVKLEMASLGTEIQRMVSIIKLREAKIAEGRYPFRFSRTGIVVERG